MACGMPEPCKCPSLDSCQKTFLWTRMGVDFAPDPVFGLALQEADAEKFPLALGFESLGPFFPSQQTRSMFHSHRNGWWGDKRLIELELAWKVDYVASLDTV